MKDESYVPELVKVLRKAVLESEKEKSEVLENQQTNSNRFSASPHKSSEVIPNERENRLDKVQ